MRNEQWFERIECVGMVRTVAHADAGAAGIDGHLQVVRGIADHQGPLTADTHLRHQLAQHPGIRFAGGLVRGPGAVEQPAQFDRLQDFVEAPSRLAGRNGQPVLTRLQVVEHWQHAVEKRQVVLVRLVVVPIATAQFRVFRLRDVGGCMRKRLHQAHPDDIRRSLVGRHGAANVGDGALDATHDDLGRVEQRPVPVEGDQVKAAGTRWGHGRQIF